MVEDIIYEAVRGRRTACCSSRRVVAIVSLFAAGFALCLPLVLAWEHTFVRASAVCRNRKEEWHVVHQKEDSARRRGIGVYFTELLFTQSWRTASVIVALVCFVTWLFACPHDVVSANSQSKLLDRKCGMVFGVALYGNILLAVMGSIDLCVTGKLADAFQFLTLLVAFGILVVGRNLLCHRYLLQKASVMTNNIGAKKESRFSLKNLNSAFKWELAMLLAVAIGPPFFLVEGYEKVAYTIGSITVFALSICDLIFSIMATSLFLAPVLSALRMSSDEQRMTGSGRGNAKKLARAAKTTLAGCSIVVVSNSILYVNLVVFMVANAGEHYFMADNVYMNPFTFGIGFVSMLGGLGILLACGQFNGGKAQSSRSRGGTRRGSLGGTPQPIITFYFSRSSLFFLLYFSLPSFLSSLFLPYLYLPSPLPSLFIPYSSLPSFRSFLFLPSFLPY
jgi:hypothetical protein